MCVTATDIAPRTYASPFRPCVNSVCLYLTGAKPSGEVNRTRVSLFLRRRTAWKTRLTHLRCLVARFLFSLGLRRTPSIVDLLGLASDPTDKDRRDRALKFFLSHFSDYASSYNPVELPIPFVPAMKGGAATLTKPTEVFTDIGCSVLGFATLDPAFKDEASKFGLSTHPPTSEVTKVVVDQPPKDSSAARGVFAYLSTRVSGSPVFHSISYSSITDNNLSIRFLGK
jgi:hypothetical protein